MGKRINRKEFFFLLCSLIAVILLPIITKGGGEKIRRTNKEIHDSVEYTKMEAFIDYINDSCYVVNKKDYKLIKRFIHEN